MQARIATSADLDGITETLWAAFEEDPLWRWAFPDHRTLKPWWRFYIEGALRYPWVWVLGDYAAASVWIPPGGTELATDAEGQIGGLLEELVGERASLVMELLERFDASHPQSPPHYYLSLLGIDPRLRGKGLGMQLLGENLSRIDAEGLGAYLESSNPGNDKRYEQLGFAKLGKFSTPGGDRQVATMWREPHGRETLEP